MFSEKNELECFCKKYCRYFHIKYICGGGVGKPDFCKVVALIEDK
jgi:hypothetical protein